MHSTLITRFFAVIFILGACILGMNAPLAAPAQQDGKKIACAAMDRPCLLKEMESLTPTIDNTAWRDQTYRELAKTYTYEGQIPKALAIIPKVQNNDTRAMTIRGIGMAAASSKLSRPQYNALWTSLTAEAAKIGHAPSRAIAFTYIAMSQAFAGDDEAARATAAKMDNAALRNKAYGETAEIDAERGDLKNALAAIAGIDTPSYRNKAYDTVSRIFLERAYVSEAYECAKRIDNAYLKAKSIQRILNKGNKEEEDMEPKTATTKEVAD